MARLALALGIFADLGSVRRLNNTRAEKKETKANGSGIKIHKYSSLYSHISIIMSFHIHFVRFISDARLLLKPPAAGKFVNINIYTADRHWLGRWQPQQCKRRPPPHLLLVPGDASLPVTDRT